MIEVDVESLREVDDLVDLLGWSSRRLIDDVLRDRGLVGVVKPHVVVEPPGAVQHEVTRAVQVVDRQDVQSLRGAETVEETEELRLLVFVLTPGEDLLELVEY